MNVNAPVRPTGVQNGPKNLRMLQGTRWGTVALREPLGRRKAHYYRLQSQLPGFKGE